MLRLDSRSLQYADFGFSAPCLCLCLLATSMSYAGMSGKRENVKQEREMPGGLRNCTSLVTQEWTESGKMLSRGARCQEDCVTRFVLLTPWINRAQVEAQILIVSFRRNLCYTPSFDLPTLSQGKKG